MCRFTLAYVFTVGSGLLALCGSLSAQRLTPNPAEIAVTAGEVSREITIELIFLPPSTSGVGTIAVDFPAALLGRATTSPSQVTYSYTAGVDRASTRLRVDTRVDAPPGIYPVVLRDRTLGAGDATLTLEVSSAPSFEVSVSPRSLRLSPGESGGTITVRTTAVRFNEPIVHRIVGLPPFIDAGRGRTVRPPYPDAELALAVLPGAGPGLFRGRVESSGGGITVAEPIRVEVVPPPSFRIALDTDRIALRAGAERGELRLSIVRELGFEAPIEVSVRGLPGFLDVAGESTLRAGEASTTLEVSLIGEAPPKTYPGEVVAIGGGVARSLRFAVAVLPPLPVIERLVPARVANGSVRVGVRLLGAHFAPGAVVSSSSARVTVESSRRISASLVEAVVSVRADAIPGPVRLEVTNPSGERTAEGGLLHVVSADSAAAPFSVASAIVLAPRPGAHLARGEAVYAHGLLVVTGSGTVIGRWLLDGAVFDRFAVAASAGNPVEVSSRLPIPQAALGEHRLQLVVDHPQPGLETPEVPILQTRYRATGLRLLTPADGFVGRPSFHWSLVPGASGYELEFETSSGDSVMVRTGRVSWEPTGDRLAELGTGVVRWRVRPSFPGGGSGEVTPWRRLAIPPDRVELELSDGARDSAGRLRISWSGGSPGLIYMIEVRSLSADRVVFSALTLDEFYIFPERALAVGGPYRVRVRALASDGSERGRSEHRRISSVARGDLFVPASLVRSSDEWSVTPAPGEVLAIGRPLITASWSAAVAIDEVALSVDEVEVSRLAEIGPTSISYRPPIALTDGEHTATLSIVGETRSWSFTVDRAGRGDGSDADASPTELGWRTRVEATASVTDAPHTADETRLTLSGQMNLEGERFGVRSSADLAWSHELESGGRSGQESESWRIEGERGERGTVVAGYGTPRFLAPAELLSGGLVRGGSEVEIGSSLVRLIAYDSFDPELGNVATGRFASDQDLQAAALRFGGDERRFLVQAIGLRAETAAGPFSPGNEGSAFGLFGRYRVSPALTVVAEAASGELEPDAGPQRKRDGGAVRLGFSGARGTLRYDLNLRHSEADFVNLAGAGLAPASRSGLDAVDLSLSKSFARATLSLGVRHHSGDAGLAGSARTVGSDLNYSGSPSDKLQISAGVNLTTTREAAAAALGPETDLVDWGTTLSSTQSLGGLQVSENLSLQWHRDRVAPLSDTLTTSVGLSAYGGFAEHGHLSASVNATRLGADSLFGDTDSLSLSFEPAWEIPSLSLSIHPYVSYNESRNDTVLLEASGELHRLRLAWEPPWKRKLLSVEVTTEWNRSRNGSLATGWERRYTTVLSLSWGAEGSRRLGSSAGSRSGSPLGSRGRSALGEPGSPLLAAVWPPHVPLSLRASI